MLIVSDDFFDGPSDRKESLTNLSIERALADLAHAGWLEVGKKVTVGARMTEQRIRKGRLAIAADKKRPDES